MVYLNAFLLGGALCAIAQAIMLAFRFKSATPCLVAFLCAGGVLGVAGLVAPLEESCQAGIIIAPIDSGFGFLNGVFAALGGEFFGIAFLFGAIAVTISLGVLAGWLGARVDTRR